MFFLINLALKKVIDLTKQSDLEKLLQKANLPLSEIRSIKNEINYFDEYMNKQEI